MLSTLVVETCRRYTIYIHPLQCTSLRMGTLVVETCSSYTIYIHPLQCTSLRMATLVAETYRSLLCLQYIFSQVHLSVLAAIFFNTVLLPPLQHVVFVGDKVALERISLRVFLFPLSIKFHQFSILVFMYTLHLPEGEKGIPWEPSKINAVMEIDERYVEK
jgi:hypothetical protein